MNKTNYVSNTWLIDVRDAHQSTKFVVLGQRERERTMNTIFSSLLSPLSLALRSLELFFSQTVVKTMTFGVVQRLNYFSFMLLICDNEDHFFFVEHAEKRSISLIIRSHHRHPFDVQWRKKRRRDFSFITLMVPLGITDDRIFSRVKKIEIKRW